VGEGAIAGAGVGVNSCSCQEGNAKIALVLWQRQQKFGVSTLGLMILCTTLQSCSTKMNRNYSL
jgi:hypothetical protein